MDAKAVDFVYYAVTDLERAVSFYRDTLGLALERHDEELGWAELAAPPTTLALGEAESGLPVSPGAGGAGLALAVDGVEAAVEELREAGASVAMDALDTGVCDMAVVADPDGNTLLLHRRHDGTHGRSDPLP